MAGNWKLSVAYKAQNGVTISTQMLETRRAAYAAAARVSNKDGVLGYNILPPKPTHHDQTRFTKFEGQFKKYNLPFNDDIPF